MQVVPKLVRAVTRTEVAITFYYPQYFAVIAQNTQHCGFGSALPSEESDITHKGQFTPVWEPLPYA